MNNYEEKKQNRIERYKELAALNNQKSNTAFQRSNNMVSCIPMGQPILVGHHSERGHRNLLNKSWTLMGKSFELSDKAKYYEAKAQAAENNNLISSDDPDAIKKLNQKLEFLAKAQEMMKAANKIVKSKNLSEVQKVAELVKIGFTGKKAIEILTPDYLNRIGFASYSLTNNNANIRTVKQRITLLEKRATQTTTEKIINGVRVVDNVEDNRLQLFFDGKPSEEVRNDLKHNGFRWSGFNGCWQKNRSNYANYSAENIIQKHFTN